jgi:chromosome segregation ATPase
LDANPILEGFGNAKTVLNNNSSRFGKFTKMLFTEREEKHDARLIGAEIETYLLEKSRVVHQDSGERNYHAFYYLCGAAAEFPQFELGNGSPEDFHYLNQSGCTTFNGDASSDKKDFKELREAFNTLQVPVEEQTDVFAIVAGILHMGNIDFAEGKGEKSKIKNEEQLKKTARVLGVDVEGLRKRLLTRNITVENKVISKPLSAELAMANRDSIAKGLYDGLFLWVVKRINSVSGAKASETTTAWIGTLDIFGFEIFENNSFEQFCINFANERLQSFFNYHVLKTEQELYRREALLWTPLDLPDNQPVIDLVMLRPTGVLPILDSACIQPKGDATIFTDNLFAQHGDNPDLKRVLRDPAAKSAKGRQHTKFNGFAVQHYAGFVTYDASNFLVKNQDTTDPDTALLFNASSGPVCKEICVVGTADKTNKPRRGSCAGFTSVSSVFSHQLETLSQTLKQTTPYFVRCIKPNQTKKPWEFVDSYVQPQLRYGGLIEALRIIKCGFPTRCSYDRMFETFGDIRSSFPTCVNLNRRDFTEAIVNVIGGEVDRTQYQLGLSMIFFRPGQQTFFQKILQIAPESINKEQRKAIHKFLIHKRIVRMRGAVRAWVRMRHLFIFRRIQKTAQVMSIVNRTFMRALRRARIRLGDVQAAREHERMKHDQKFQAGLMAAQRVAALEKQEEEWKLKMKQKMAELESVRLEADEAQGRLKTQQANGKKANAANAELTSELKDATAQLEEQRRLYSEHQTRFQSEVSNLTAEKARLTASLAAEKTALAQQLSAAEAKLGTTEQQLRLLTEESQTGEERNQQLNSALKEAQNDLEEQITRLRAQLVDAEEREKDLEGKMTQLKQEQGRTQTELRDTMARLERTEATAKEEQENARANDARLNKQCQEEQVRADTAEDSLRSLQGSSAASSSEMEQEIASLQRRQTELTDASAKSKAAFIAREEELEEELRATSAAAATSTSDGETQLRERDEKITQATAQLSALRVQYESVQSQLEAKEKAVAAAAKRFEEQRTQSETTAKAKAGVFEQDMEAARAKLTSQKAAQEELEEELLKAKTQSQTLESELRSLKEEMESSTERSTRRAAVVETETGALQTEKKRLMARLEEVTRDAAAKDVKLNQLAAEMKAGLADWEEKTKRTEEEAAETSRKLKKQLQDAKETSLASAKEELAAANLRIKAVSEEHDRSTTEMQDELNRAVALKDADLHTANAELESTRAELDAITHTFTSHRDEADVVQQRFKNNEVEKEDELNAMKKKLGDSVTEVAKLRMDGEDSTRKVAGLTRRESELAELHSEELTNLGKAHDEETTRLSAQLAEMRSQLDASKSAQEEAVEEAKEAGFKAAASAASAARAKAEAEAAEEALRTKETPSKSTDEIRALEEQLTTATDKATTFERRVTRFARNESELLRDLEKSKEDARASRRTLASRERLHGESSRVFASQLRNNEMALKKMQKKYTVQSQEQGESATLAYTTLATELSAARKEMAEARERDITALQNDAVAKQTITGLQRSVRRVQTEGEASVEEVEKRLKMEAQQQIRTQQMEMEQVRSDLAAAKSATAAKEAEIKELRSQETQSSARGASSVDKINVLSEALKGKEDELEAAGDEMNKLRREAISAKQNRTEMDTTLEELKAQLAQARSEATAERGGVQADLEAVEMERDNLEAQVKILKLQVAGSNADDLPLSKDQMATEEESEALESIDVLLSA